MTYTIEYDTYLKRWILTDHNVWFLIANEDRKVCEKQLEYIIKNQYKKGEQIKLF